MSLPIYADLDKSITDLFKDDFDTKYSLKVKAAAPYRVNVTQTTEFSSKNDKTSLNGKVSVKWAHESGFTLDKLEIKDDGALTTESSLTGVYPGVKLEFKGNDSFKGDLGLIYKCSAATVTSEIDLVELSSIRGSVVAQAGPALVGASAEYRTGEKSELKSFDVGARYAFDNAVIGLKTTNKFAKYNGAVSYLLNNKYTLGGQVSFTPEKNTTTAAFLCGWNYCPNTSLKVKADLDGVVATSIKQSLSKTCTVVGAAQLNVNDPAAVKVGVTATLG